MILISNVTQLQLVIDYIDGHIDEEISPEKLAEIVGYSPYHFYRIFEKQVGYTIMDFVGRRKLQFALYELAQGEKIINIALKYGYETHSGFTRAFKKCFGSPPSLYKRHCPLSKPPRIDLSAPRQKKLGGIVMQPRILTSRAFDIAGKTFASSLENVSYTRDAPAFWEQGIHKGESIESTLYGLLSPKQHGEYCVNLSNSQHKRFTYLFAVNYDQDKPLPSGLTKFKVPASTYAIFKTPPVRPEQFVSTIKETWLYILKDWLPTSSYEVDETGFDYEYYDENCHDWEYEKINMEIHLPIKEKDKG